MKDSSVFNKQSMAGSAEGGGGGSGFLDKIGGKIKGKGKELGAKAYKKIDQWATPEAQEQPSVLGNATEAGMDLYRGTIDNVGRQIMKGGGEILDSTRAEFQGIANIFHPPIYRVDQIIGNTAKAALETANEGAHLAKEAVARPLATLETGLLEGANMVDHLVHGTRKLLGAVPVIGGILKAGAIVTTLPVTLGTKVARLPVKGLGKAGGWINEKLDAGTNKVRGFAISGTGGHKEIPAAAAPAAAQKPIDLAAERAKRQPKRNGRASSGEAHAMAA